MDKSLAFAWVDNHAYLEPFKYYALGDGVAIKVISRNQIVVDSHSDDVLYIDRYER